MILDKKLIATLLTTMENQRGQFAVVVAGYDELMANFINSNPGLESRFNTFLKFEDYNSNELLDIFIKLCNENDYRLSENAKMKLIQYFDNICLNRNSNFGNGRDVRNLFEKTITNQSRRIYDILNLATTKEELMTITTEDLQLNFSEKKEEC